MDEVGDDDGPGGYEYPTASEFKDGVCDITGLTIDDEGDAWGFEVGIAGPVEDVYDFGSGFSVQVLQLYVRDPDAGDDVPARTEGRPGTGLTFQRPYHYLVHVMGDEQRVEDASSDASAFDEELGDPNVLADSEEGDAISASGDPAARTISFTVEKDVIGGGAIEDKEIALVSFVQDGFGIGGIRTAVATEASDYIIGIGDNPTENNHTAFDMLDPDGVVEQSDALSYTEGEPATVPLFPVGDPTEGPTKDGWQQQAKLAAEDGDSQDGFGSATALSSDGTTALVGAYKEEGPDGKTIGSAYVLTRSDEGWSQQAKLDADGGDGGGNFGNAVALSADGDTALVGDEFDDTADGEAAGSAYVFTRSGGEWTRQRKLTADDAQRGDTFGISVSLSADGTTALIGSPAVFGRSGGAYVFTRSGQDWNQQARLEADGDDDVFGISVSLSADGATALVGASADEDPNGSGAGSAYVFTDDSGWSQQTKLVADDGDGGDRFGSSVALSADGSTALVGASADEDPNGESDAGLGAGSAYVFIDSSGWSHQAKLSGDENNCYEFGGSVALSNDGATALVGAPGSSSANTTDTGSAYAFASDGGWSQEASIVPRDRGGGPDFSDFGSAVALSNGGSTALVGADADGDPFNTLAGSAYVFEDESSAPTLPGQDSPATDPDGDGLFEDVDGDGETDLFDALAYYNNRDSDAIQHNPNAFDFDDDGSPGTLFDVLELYNRIS